MKFFLKSGILIGLVLIVTNVSFAQIERLFAIEKATDRKVAVGMSPDEVKKALGRPKAIESGFPNSTESILSELPEQAGQLNNSTWFYFLDRITIDLDDPTYKVNGFSVSEDDYRAYERSNKVYLYKEQIIPPGMADGYILLKDPRLKIVPKNPDETYENVKPKKVRRTFSPVYCVIFDRGTQVVAATKMLFLKVGF